MGELSFSISRQVSRQSSSSIGYREGFQDISNNSSTKQLTIARSSCSSDFFPFMGCRISSSSNDNFSSSNNEMPNETTDQQPTVDYKARLERKQCLVGFIPLWHNVLHLYRFLFDTLLAILCCNFYVQAKETPEPIYDLADCNLKDVPSGVFIMCKVLRKELLSLSNNKLTSLNGGGALVDLQLVMTLNLSSNRFKKLPDEIYRLENLRVSNLLRRIEHTYL